MIVACEQCHTEYRLDPAKLGPVGHKVKCTQCKHVWLQKAEEPAAADDAFGFGLNLGYEAPAVVQPAPEEAPTLPAKIHDDLQPDTFDAILKQTAAAIAPAPKIPESVIPTYAAHTTSGPVYKVMGMGSAQFGASTFLLCCFATLIPLFLGKGLLTRLWPPAVQFYSALGIEVHVPGEGLRIGNLVAENRVDKAGRALSVEGQLSNMTEKPAPYPALRLTLSSAYGAVLKTWTLDNKDAKPLAPGDAVPVKLEFKDAPEGGTDVELKVVER